MMSEQTIFELEAEWAGGLRGRITIVRQIVVEQGGNSESIWYEVQERLTADNQIFYFLDERNKEYEGKEDGLLAARTYVKILLSQMLSDIVAKGDLRSAMKKMGAVRVDKSLLKGERHYDGRMGRPAPPLPEEKEDSAEEVKESPFDTISAGDWLKQFLNTRY
jgi:hypothetical protein